MNVMDICAVFVAVIGCAFVIDCLWRSYPGKAAAGEPQQEADVQTTLERPQPAVFLCTRKSTCECKDRKPIA